MPKKKAEPKACTFCGRTREKGVNLVSGPGEICICSVCVEVCNQVLRAEVAPHDPSSLMLRRADAALVVVDVQERLLAEVAERDRVLANVGKLFETARILGVPVVVTEHAAKTFGPTALKPPVEPVHKIVFSCFGSDEFRSRLQELHRGQLILCGLETHICVCQTALDGIKAGYQVHVVKDACSSRTAENHTIGLGKLAVAGAIPASTDMVIFELLERAGTDEFRALLPLIKQK